MEMGAGPSRKRRNDLKILVVHNMFTDLDTLMMSAEFTAGERKYIITKRNRYWKLIVIGHINKKPIYGFRRPHIVNTK